MSSGELEGILVEEIRAMVASGVKPEDMVIEMGGMRWKWCQITRRWGLHENQH